MLMGLATRESLTELHPDPLHIFKLWQTFLENVNPLIKIVHTPTLQPQILEATGDLPTVGKELEALMFAIYCIALGSLQADEVRRSFGESKKKLLSRYRQGAQLALSKASFLRTSNLMVLQAFMLYLVSLYFQLSELILTDLAVVYACILRPTYHLDYERCCLADCPENGDPSRWFWVRT